MASTSNGHPRWPVLAEAIQQARIRAGYKKRAQFGRAAEVNDSTLQIIEGKRRGNISEEMLDAVTATIGWPAGHWRTYLADPARAEIQGPITGDRLREWREARGLDVPAAATLFSVGPQAIRRWESGTPIGEARAEQIRAVMSAEQPSSDPIRALSDVDLLDELLRRAREREARGGGNGSPHLQNPGGVAAV